MTLANALQDRINFKLREKKHASVTRHLQRHMYLRTNMHWRNSTQPKGSCPRAFRCQLIAVGTSQAHYETPKSQVLVGRSNNRSYVG